MDGRNYQITRLYRPKELTVYDMALWLCGEFSHLGR